MCLSMVLSIALVITNKIEGSVVANLIQEREHIGLLQKNKLVFINAIIIILFVISLFNIINNTIWSLISRTKMIRFEVLSCGIVASIYSVVM